MEDIEECAGCGWTGTDEQKDRRKEPGTCISTLICPKCGNEDFYADNE